MSNDVQGHTKGKEKLKVQTSVADPFHFDTEPYPLICFVNNWLGFYEK